MFRVPPITDVLVYRESPVNEWVGPYTIVAGDSKNVWLNVDGKMKLASVDKVKEYRSAYEEKWNAQNRQLCQKQAQAELLMSLSKWTEFSSGV